MENRTLHINSSKRTPLIYFKEGKLFITGRSIIENPCEFYNPVFSLISLYISDNKTGIDLYFAFEHINTGSVKWLFVLLRGLFKNRDTVRLSSINWYFEKDDDDMQELGYIFHSLVPCRFSINEVDVISDNFYENIMGSNL